MRKLIALRVRCTTDYYMGDFRSALAHAREGVTMYEDDDSPPESDIVPELLAMCTSVGSLALWHLGYPEKEAVRRSAEALERIRGIDPNHSLVITLAFDSWLQQFVGNVAAARARAEEMCDLCEQHGLFSMYHLGMTVLAWALARQNGNDEKHLGHMADAIDGWIQTGGRLIVPYCQYRLAECRLAREEHKQALSLLDGAISSASRRFEYWWLPECHRLRASLRARLRHAPADVTADLESCLEMAMNNDSRALLRRGVKTYEELQSALGVVVSEDILHRAYATLSSPVWGGPLA